MKILRERLLDLNEEMRPGQKSVLTEAAAYIAELEAERENIIAVWKGEHIRKLEAEIARLTAELATIDEAAVRNGVALQYEAREAERERMLKLGLSFILDQQAREDFIQLVRSTP